MRFFIVEIIRLFECVNILALTVLFSSVGASFARDIGQKVATLGKRSRAQLAPTEEKRFLL